MEVIYYWFDYGILRFTGEAAIVEQAIAEKDYDKFMEYYNKYNSSGSCFFPSTAILYKDGIELGTIAINNPVGFSMITYSEFECG